MEDNEANQMQPIVFLGVKVRKRDAQVMRLFLSENNLSARSLKAKSMGDFVVFPVEKKFSKEDSPALSKLDFSFVESSFELIFRREGDVKDFLSGKLTSQEMDSVVKSFDMLGNVAITEIPRELMGKERLVADAIMKANPPITTVCKKTGAHSGVFRAEPVEIIGGVETKFALYRESGASFRITLGEVFFSPRLSHERTRISKLIKEGEVVAALFAGVGPFPIIFAKNTGMEKAYAIELNPAAFQDMVHNIKENKVEGRVIPILADVKKFVPSFLAGKCDRAVMPLPKGAEHFLEETILSIKPKGGIVHFYGFAEKENPFDDAVKKINSAAEKCGRIAKIVFKRKVRDYSPDTIQVVIDFEVGVCRRKQASFLQ